MYENISDAHEKALKDACEKDRIVVFGSFHTVAEVQNSTVIPAQAGTHPENVRN